jgi:hypothetical protein
MIRYTKKADNAVRLTQKQEKVLYEIIELQMTAIQLAGLYKIPPQIIENKMKQIRIL